MSNNRSHLVDCALYSNGEERINSIYTPKAFLLLHILDTVSAVNELFPDYTLLGFSASLTPDDYNTESVLQTTLRGVTVSDT